jgi:hypothetical protein
VGRRSTSPALWALLAVLLLAAGSSVVALPVFRCALCGGSESKADCGSCGFDGRASLYANWSVRSWITGRRFVSPFGE